MRLADRMLPGAARRCAGSLLRTSQLPFPVDEVTLVGYGAGATVFRLGSDPDAPVLKVYRRSLDRNVARLFEQLRQVRGRYREIRSWFEDTPELVQPSSHLILGGPLLGLQAVGCVQPFVHGDHQDLLADHSDPELLRLFAEDRAVRAQFTSFARSTLDAYDRHGRCLDLLGRNNFLLVGDSGPARLVLLDFGVFDARAGTAHDSERVAKMQPVLERLRSLSAQLRRGSGG